MKRRTLITAVAFLFTAATAVAALGQNVWEADRSLFVELDEKYDALSWANGQVGAGFRAVRDLAENGLAAPEVASMATHAENLLLLLVGTEDAGLTLSALPNLLPRYVDNDYLLAQGGIAGAVERLGVAVEAYLEFARSNADLLCAFWADQTGVADPTLFAAGVDTMVGRVSEYWKRVSRLCQAAVDAARRAAGTKDGDGLAIELASIYACAATVGGYGTVVTASGPTPSECGFLSTLHQFTMWVDDLYVDLVGAFAAAQTRSG